MLSTKASKIADISVPQCPPPNNNRRCPPSTLALAGAGEVPLLRLISRSPAQQQAPQHLQHQEAGEFICSPPPPNAVGSPFLLDDSLLFSQLVWHGNAFYWGWHFPLWRHSCHINRNIPLWSSSCCINSLHWGWYFSIWCNSYYWNISIRRGCSCCIWGHFSLWCYHSRYGT